MTTPDGYDPHAHIEGYQTEEYETQFREQTGHDLAIPGKSPEEVRQIIEADKFADMTREEAENFASTALADIQEHGLLKAATRMLWPEDSEEDNEQYDLENWKTVPNAISAARLALAIPNSILLEKYPDSRSIRLWCTAWAATDFVDGQLARILKQKSHLGRKLDPVADKVYDAMMVRAGIRNGMIPKHLGYGFLLEMAETSAVSVAGVADGYEVQVKRSGKYAEGLKFGSVYAFINSEDPLFRQNPAYYYGMKAAAYSAGVAGLKIGEIAREDYVGQVREHLGQRNGLVSKAAGAVVYLVSKVDEQKPPLLKLQNERIKNFVTGEISTVDHQEVAELFAGRPADIIEVESMTIVDADNNRHVIPVRRYAREEQSEMRFQRR